MDAELWQRVDRIFAGALECEPAELASYLDRTAGGDGALRRQVEDLLAADRQATEMFGPCTTPAAEDAERPARLGPYRLLRVLGEGGMGTVFLGVRDDDQYHQLVTVKILKRGDSPDLRQRFRTERQILASLSHPYVARLLDGGATPDGTPYLVMEYVQGQRLDAHCVSMGLSVEERLRLFMKVCAAVSYAHRHLCVHRDLKPSNILVTRDGDPKLLDFGIAKLLDPAWLPGGNLETRTGQRPLTPRYASPEQVRGEATSTATDVYSLGVLLYELLTGRCPYALASGLPGELEQAICEQRPAPPSRATGSPVLVEKGEAADDPGPLAADLSRRLHGDLDAILGKALRKDPSERYESVDLLALDLDRHLRHLPVAARRGRWRYRAGRALRRHWLAAGALATILTLALVSSIFLARAAERTARERDKATQALAFLVQTFEAADPLAENRADMSARELLDAGAEEMESRLADQPEVRATVLEAIGQVYTNLGLFDRARPLLASSLELRREVLPARHREIGSSLHNLAVLDYEQGDYQTAGTGFAAAVDHRLSGLGDDHLATAESRIGLAKARRALDDDQGAESLLLQALPVLRQRLGPDHAQVASCLTLLAQLARKANDFERAEQLYRSALDILRQDPAQAGLGLAETLTYFALLRTAQGHFAETEELLREALDLVRPRLPEHHPIVLEILDYLAVALQRQEKLEQAETLSREVVALRRKASGEANPHLAYSLNSLGVLLIRRGRPEEAQSLLREALTIRTRVFGEEHRQVAQSLCNLGKALRAGQPSEAEQLYLRSAAMYAKLGGERNARVAYPLLGLGDLHALHGDADAARESYDKALDIRRGALPADHWLVKEVEGRLADLDGGGS
ncbi:MAG: serine/threonine protein kinase [bacterium]|nr:serine/threonine protein kinase [bacterium]